MEFKIVDEMLVFHFTERLDTVAAMSLQKEIVDTIAAQDKAVKVRFDFAGVQYISSGFLRILIFVLRMKGKDFSIANIGPEILQILSMAGLDQLIKMD